MPQLANTDKERLAQAALQAQIEKIKQAPADSQVVKANQHLLGADTAPLDFGFGAGELSCVGALAYVLDCSLFVAGTYTCLVTFNASGFSWDFGAFTAQVGGTFLVNPKTVAGKCRFTCVVADIGEGLVSFSLFSKDYALYGTFVGDTEGLDVADMSGTGTLTVS